MTSEAGRTKQTSKPLLPPDASQQAAFHQILLAARNTWLIDALRDTVRVLDQSELKRQLSTYAPGDVQQLLAALGIRDEEVFPTPIVLESRPTLVGYYRLLTGVSQKRFYHSETGLSGFRAMESDGKLTELHRTRLPSFCQALSTVLADLMRQIKPGLTGRDLPDLQLLTFGSFLYGSNNNTVGKLATQGVFVSIADIVETHRVTRDEKKLTIQTAAGRTFEIALASDPDVRIREQTGDAWQNLLTMEIKGGTDNSNVYNRGGEAEKSHKWTAPQRANHGEEQVLQVRR